VIQNTLRELVMNDKIIIILDVAADCFLQGLFCSRILLRVTGSSVSEVSRQTQWLRFQGSKSPRFRPLKMTTLWCSVVTQKSGIVDYFAA